MYLPFFEQILVRMKREKLLKSLCEIVLSKGLKGRLNQHASDTSNFDYLRWCCFEIVRQRYKALSMPCIFAFYSLS